MDSGNLQLISNSVLNYMFCMHRECFNDAELKYVCGAIDYDKIEDRYLADDPALYPYIHWHRLNKMQAVRIAARDLTLLNYIDLKRFEYKIREVFFLIKRDFKLLFEHFNFDFNNLTHDDAYFLLCLGSDEFLAMVELEKYQFNFIEAINIIRAYNYRRDVLLRLNYEDLKNYQITEVLIMTGEEFLDIFDLDCLSTLNWLELLMYQPNFISRCDFQKFIEGDPFNLVQLIVMFDKPDLSYLLDEIDLKKITPFGWEKLLIARPDKFGPLCDFKKLNESHWINIGAYSPELLVYKQ